MAKVRQCVGYSLIEMMVSLFLLSILLLGLDAVQITALRETKAAYYFSVATEQLHVMAEYLASLRGNPIDDQLLGWNKQNRDVLPQGRGIVSGQYPTYSVSVFWGHVSQDVCSDNKLGLSGCLRLVITL